MLLKGELMERFTDVERVARIVTQRMESLHRAGVSHLPKARSTQGSALTTKIEPNITAAPPAPQPQPRAAAPADSSSAAPKASPAIVARSLFEAYSERRQTIPAQERAAVLEGIKCEVAACTRCNDLVRNRTQTVFGVGNPNARICFFGEAPGADEDRL